KVNAYLLYRHQYEERDSNFDPDLPEKLLTHREFQEELALRLIHDGYEVMKGQREASNQDMIDRVLVRTTRRWSARCLELPPSRTQLPAERFLSDPIHDPIKGSRAYCIWCKHQFNSSKR